MKNGRTLHLLFLVFAFSANTSLYAESGQKGCEPETQQDHSPSISEVLKSQLKRIKKSDLTLAVCSDGVACSYDQLLNQTEKEYSDSVEDQAFLESLKKSLRESEILSDEDSPFVIRSKNQNSESSEESAWVYTFDKINSEVIRHNIETGKKQAVDIDVDSNNTGGPDISFDFSKDAKNLEVYDQETGEVRQSFSLDDAFADLNNFESSDTSNTIPSKITASQPAIDSPQEVDLYPASTGTSSEKMSFGFEYSKKGSKNTRSYFHVDQFASRIKLRSDQQSSQEKPSKLERAFISPDGNNLYRVNGNFFEHYTGVSITSAPQTISHSKSLENTRQARSSDRIQLGKPQATGSFSESNTGFSDSAISQIVSAYNKAIQPFDSHANLTDEFISNFTKNFQPSRLESSSIQHQDVILENQGSLDFRIGQSSQANSKEVLSNGAKQKNENIFSQKDGLKKQKEGSQKITSNEKKSTKTSDTSENSKPRSESWPPFIAMIESRKLKLIS